LGAVRPGHVLREIEHGQPGQGCHGDQNSLAGLDCGRTPGRPGRGLTARRQPSENPAHSKLVDQPIYAKDPPVSPRPKVAAERRAAIVRATIRCVARDGYARLTMKRVAAEAGVSPGILHYYFRDKRAILAS